MHLKKIEVQGFKSFADKIELNFKDGITAIVGPNGSGKSNISDAIRWVLGEQSVKTLRGSRMEDIIFSGTARRRALGFTEVTIVFDNKDGLIPIEYQEVAVTRRMFRSGESEYYINKNTCRLRDIRELFMDTGIGKDGYSIIGQGRVDEILSNRPEDRRVIFEEAAGIVKYKTKKELSERKLDATKDNLIRIEDILKELKRQVNYLKDQSEKAKIYLEWSRELKELEVNLFIRQIDDLEQKVKEIEVEKAKVELEIGQILKDKDTIETKFNSMKVTIEELDTLVNKLQNQAMDTLNELNEKKNNLKLFQEQEKFLLKDRARINREIEGLKLNRDKKSKEKNNLTRENLELEEELKELRNKHRDQYSDLERINKKISKEEIGLEEDRDQLIAYNNLIINSKNEINNFSSFEENISKRISQLKKEMNDLEISIENNRTRMGELEKSEREKQRISAKINKSLTQLKIDDEKYKSELNEKYTSLNSLKAQLQGSISNYNLLKNMEEDYEGYYKSVKNLMVRCKQNNKLNEKVQGIIVDLIGVDEKYEKAIDVALGGSLQNIVTRNEADAKYIIDYLRQHKLGRITFLPLSNIKGGPIKISEKDRQDYKILGLGSELIKYESMYKNIIEYLLGRTIIVENLQDGIEAARRFNHRYRVTTLAGDIVNVGGSMTGGSMPKISGNLLNRRLRMDRLREEISNYSDLKSQIEEEIHNIKLKTSEIHQTIGEQSDSLQKTNIDIIKTENEKNKELDELERNQKLIEGHSGEIHELNSELMEIKEKEDKSSAKVRLLEKDVGSLKQVIEASLNQLNKEKLIRDQMTNMTNEVKIKINLLENNYLANRRNIESITDEVKKMKISKNDKIRENQTNDKEIEILAEKSRIIREEIEGLFQLENKVRGELEGVRSKRKLLMKDYYLEQDQLKNINEKYNKFEKTRNKWNIEETRCDVQLDNINKKLLDSYGLSHSQALEYWLELEDLDGTNSRVKELKGKIKGLGNVDISSIEEYEKILERYEFMAKQHKDLLAAKADLESVIIDMEGKMKEQFMENFTLIGKEFNKIFSILFDGGKAHLLLSDPEDILNSGIEINAQPPGKKLQNLNLLSGGEKSLTAVALLFAILQIKPTPFCVLDEIDAALDEANINRYTNYLKSLSHETQFIIITHRRSTMETADILYGVTMEEEGISKIISVELKDNMDEIAS